MPNCLTRPSTAILNRGDLKVMACGIAAAFSTIQPRTYGFLLALEYPSGSVHARLSGLQAVDR